MDARVAASSGPGVSGNIYGTFVSRARETCADGWKRAAKKKREREKKENYYHDMRSSYYEYALLHYIQSDRIIMLQKLWRDNVDLAWNTFRTSCI